MTRLSIAEQLGRAEVLLTLLATDSELQERVQTVGYDAAAIAEGRALYEAAADARSKQQVAQAMQHATTATARALRAKVDAQVAALTKMARAIFPDDPGVLATLAIRPDLRKEGRRRAAHADTTADADAGSGRARRGTPTRSQAALFDRADVLYTNALNDPAILAALQQVGYGAERLAQERADLAALMDADTAQEARKAESRKRTAEQQAALLALDAWLKRFRGITMIALRDRPDLLDRLKPR